MPRPENAELYRKYQALADATPDVTFVGRLGTYRYYNMDQVVGQALALFNRIAESEKLDIGLTDARLARVAREMTEVNGVAGQKVALGPGD